MARTEELLDDLGVAMLTSRLPTLVETAPAILLRSKLQPDTVITGFYDTPTVVVVALAKLLVNRLAYTDFIACGDSAVQFGGFITLMSAAVNALPDDAETTRSVQVLSETIMNAGTRIPASVDAAMLSLTTCPVTFMEYVVASIPHHDLLTMVLNHPRYPDTLRVTVALVLAARSRQDAS